MLAHRGRARVRAPALALTLALIGAVGCAPGGPGGASGADAGNGAADGADAAETQSRTDETGAPEDGEDGDDGAAAGATGDDTAEAAASEARAQRREPDQRRGLTGQNLYRLLVADLARRQGNLGVALQGYLETARETSDPRVAARATRLAFYAERYDAGLEAAQRWVALAPDDPEAHAAEARLRLRRGETEAAVAHLERVIEIGGDDGGWSKAAALLTDTGQTDAALTAARALAERHPQVATAHYVVGRLAANSGRTEQALSALEAALERKPAYPDALVLRARLLVQSDRADEAVAGLRKAYRRYPGNRDIAVGYVRLLADLGRREAASREMEAVHERFGSEPDVVYTLGLLSMQLELWSDARLYLERLVQMDARTSDAHYYLGRIAQQQGDCDRALQHYVKVGRGERRFDAQLRAAVCMGELDRLEEARLHLERMRQRYDGESAMVQIVLTRAQIERSAGHPERALDVLGNAVEQYPDNNDLRYARALAAARQDRFELARTDLETVLERDPDNARALNALGYMLADRNRELERARSLIERALEQNPDDAATLDSMGWVLYRQGQNRKALSYLRRAWDRQKDPEIAAHLGEVLWVLGRREEARRVWQQGREVGPDNEVLEETIERLTP